MSANDHTLLQRWIDHRDPLAFRELAVRYAGLVYGVCQRVLRNAADAEDVAQGCFLYLAQSRTTPKSLGGWLYRLATHRALDHLKAEERRRAREKRFAATKNSVVHASEWEEIEQFVDEAVASLPEKLQTVIVAHFFEQRSQMAIAESLGVSRRTVAYRVAQGLEKIEKLLRRRGLNVAVAALSSMLCVNVVEAAPAALRTALGKLSLSGKAGVASIGAPSATATAVGILGGLGIMAKTICAAVVAVAALLVVVLAFWRWSAPSQDQGEDPRPTLASESAPPAAAEWKPRSVSSDMSRRAIRVVERKPEPTGLLSIHGVVKDLNGAGIPNATVAAIHLASWSDIAIESQAELTNVRDPGRVVTMMWKKHQSRLDSVPRAETDDEGAYAFYGLASGEYRLFVMHRDYLFHMRSWVGIDGEKPARQDVELVLGHVISGHLVDEKGKPVPEAIVRAVPASRGFQKGTAKLVSMLLDMFEGGIVRDNGLVRTEADGAFVLRALEPVPHDLQFKMSGFVTKTLKRVPSGTTDLTVAVERGAAVTAQVVDADLRPIVGAAWTVRRLVKSDTKSPVLTTQIEIDLLGERTLHGTTDSEGRIEIYGLSGGTFELTVAAPGFAESAYECAVLGDDLALGELVLEKPLTIGGKVLGPDGKSVAGVRLAVKRPRTGDAPSIYSPSTSEPLAETTSGDDGSFVIEKLPPGLHTIDVSVNDLADVKIRKVEAGTDDLEIRLEAGLVALLKVIDGRTREPIPDVCVNVLRIDGNFDATVMTDTDGVAELFGLTPRGRSHGYNVGRQVLAKFTRREYGVELKPIQIHDPGRAEEQEIILHRRREVAGVVLDESGNPVRHARVHVEIPGVYDAAQLFFGPADVPIPTSTKKDGSFEVKCPSRNYGNGNSANMELVASHPAFATGRIPIGKINDEEEVTLQVVLTQGVRVAGKVTDSGGSVIPGAQVNLRRVVKRQGEADNLAHLFQGRSSKNAYTKNDGSYEFPRVEAGSYRLATTAVGHARKTQPVTVEERLVTVDVVLERGGSLIGRVVDSSRNGLANIEVVAFAESDDASDHDVDREVLLAQRITARGSATTATDADGNFELDNLPEGMFSIVARADGYEPAEVGWFSPNDRVSDIVLTRLGALRMIVVGRDTQQPVTRYSIKTERVRAEGEPSASSEQSTLAIEVDNPHGEHLRENLKAGTYRVEVTAETYQKKSVTREVRKGEERELKIVLDVGIRVDVVVVDDATGMGIPNIVLNIQKIEKNEGGRKTYSWFDNVMTDERGTARITTLTDGRYKVYANHAYYAVSFDDLPWLRIPDDDGREIEIRMHAAGRIKGRFTNIRGEDSRSVNYDLRLKPVPPETTGGGESGREGKRPTSSLREQHIWIEPRNGEFEQGSIPPGKYTASFRERRFENTEGRQKQVGRLQWVELTTVEIRPEETTRLTLEKPES